MTKKELYSKLKKQNIFWSYDTSSVLSDKVIIEQTLIYADVEDIKSLFLIYDLSEIKQVWDQQIVPDMRYFKLNYYLGKLFFNISNINTYLKKKSLLNSRYEQLKKLTA
ncbi:MAG: hypothetical protein V4511_08595 [Bacteroidota bacterium]